MKLPHRLIAGVVSCCAAMEVPAFAQPLSSAFTYQGELRVLGAPATGLYDLRFRLYDAAVNGAQVGPVVCSNNLSMTDGRFTVELDFLAAFAGQQRFLEIDVRADTGLSCGDGTGYTILAPRQPLTAAPNALFALNAAAANTAASATTATTATNATQLNGQAASFYQNAANLSSGLIPSARLAGIYSSALTLNNAGNTFVGSGVGLTGVNADMLDGLDSSAFLQSIPIPLTLTGSSASHIILGENAATTLQSTGVHGLASAPTGTVHGVHGESSSTNGRGVFGQATAASGVNYGVYGESASTSGHGVYGVGTALTGLNYGVRASTDSTSGRAVFGTANATTGTTYGGRFECDSTTGYGVFGWATAATGTIYGVYGSASTSAGGYAVYASGDMGASGVKPFRIDHPDDPANKYLLHYASEAPEPQNFHNGVIWLDGAGQAVVELPPYFAKINKDPRYTLTAIGAPMPMLHIAEEINEVALARGAALRPDEPASICYFRIAGGAPGAKVSWEVKALRNDRWVQKRGAPVEVEKQDLEKGTYQHPELYGQPPEKGLNYDAHHQRPEHRPQEP